MVKPTPLKSIRKFCLWCCCGNYTEVKLCPAADCPLHKRRLGKGGDRLLKIIRAKCLDCSGWKAMDVRNCIFNGKSEEICILYPYRMGHRPKIEGRPKKRLPAKCFRARKGIVEGKR